MLKAPRGLHAFYRARTSFPHAKGKRTEFVGNTKVELEANQTLHQGAEIVAWDEEGNPLVVDERGCLTSPSVQGFLGVAPATHNSSPAVDIVIPGSDWVIWHVWDLEDDSLTSERVLAWGQLPNGDWHAFTVDTEGFVVVFDPYTAGHPTWIRHHSEGPPPKEWVESALEEHRAHKSKGAM